MSCVWMMGAAAVVASMAVWLWWRDRWMDDDVDTDFLTDWGDEL